MVSVGTSLGREAFPVIVLVAQVPVLAGSDVLGAPSWSPLGHSMGSGMRYACVCLAGPQRLGSGQVSSAPSPCGRVVRLAVWAGDLSVSAGGLSPLPLRLVTGAPLSLPTWAHVQPLPQTHGTGMAPQRSWGPGLSGVFLLWS